MFCRPVWSWLMKYRLLWMEMVMRRWPELSAVFVLQSTQVSIVVLDNVDSGELLQFGVTLVRSELGSQICSAWSVRELRLLNRGDIDVLHWGGDKWRWWSEFWGLEEFCVQQEATTFSFYNPWHRFRWWCFWWSWLCKQSICRMWNSLMVGDSSRLQLLRTRKKNE